MTTIAAPARHGMKMVEVAAAVVLIGILAAVAVPRMLDLGKEDRSARVESLMGQMRAGARSARAVALLQSALEANGKVQMENGLLVRTAHGYPLASSDGILRAADIDALRNKVVIAVDRHASPPTVTVTPLGASNACNVVYTQSSSADSPPIIAPSISGC